MRILLVIKQNKNLYTFERTIGLLVHRGHHVTVAVQDRDESRDERLADSFDPSRFSVVRCPQARTDDWSGVAPLLRSVRDCVQYLRPELQGATKLRSRTAHKLRQLLPLPVEAPALAAGLAALPDVYVNRLDAILALAERSLPTDAVYDELLAAERPDLLLVSPLIHFGSAQADLVASARRAGVPVSMLLFSWDNLSTKGYLHRHPDRMIVWNEQQREEAWALHRFPSDRVIVVGAPRFDSFFEMRRQMSAVEFHEPLGLDASKPTLLYVCSSRFVADRELAFIGEWVGQLRRSGSAPLGDCNVLVRPHPDVALLRDDVVVERIRWPAIPGMIAYVARPFGDPRAIVLRTSDAGQQGLYESIAQSAAVVGLNTSAELEAGIVGRPVFTILSEEADGQRSTVHFHYLLKEHGGFVSSAATFPEHLAQLDAALREGCDPAPIHAFIQRFLRPHGLDRPVAPLLADAIEHLATVRPTEAKAEPVAGPSGDSAVMPGGGAAAASLDAVPADRRHTLPVAYEPCRVQVYDTPEARRRVKDSAVRLDTGTVEWLQARLGIGEVLYDVGAGIGAYAIVAAKHRGAVVVAFEAGYAAHGRLCDNLRLNGCDGQVVPVALPLSDRDGVAELKYRFGFPGEDRYGLTGKPWRVRTAASEGAYVQPGLATRLDTVVGCYGLPLPNHLRIAPNAPAVPVLAGATTVLASPKLTSMLLTVGVADLEACLSHLAPLGWRAGDRRQTAADKVQVLFERF